MIVGHLVASVLVAMIAALATAIAGFGAPAAAVAYAMSVPATLVVLAARLALPLRSDDASRGLTTRSD